MIDPKCLRVGDCIRIRDWDDMADEYGLDEDGDIDIAPSFVDSMKYLCGMEGVILEIIHDTDVEAFIRLDISDGWNITSAMVELLDDEGESVDQASFFEILMT